MLCIICDRNEACYKFGDKYDICDLCHDNAIGNYISYEELNELYDINSKSIFPDITASIREMRYYLENWQKFEAKFLHAINEITNVEEKEYYMHIYNRNYKLREIKKYIVYRYYKHFTYDVSHFTDDFSLVCVPYCQFKFDDYLEFMDLSVKFTESNNKIANEYAYSLETEEEVKIKLDENFKKYNEIANNLKKKAALVYELIYIELCTLIELDDHCKMAFEVFTKRFGDTQFLNKWSENAFKLLKTQYIGKSQHMITKRFGDTQFLNKWSENAFKLLKTQYIGKSQHMITKILYEDFVKFHGNEEIVKILYSFDPNVRTLVDIKKTDIVETVHKIIHSANDVIIDREICSLRH